jgi:hypothetical protein
MSKIKVRSNFARDKVVMISGGVTLAFDRNGVALVPAQFRANVEAEMRSRPGRFWFEAEALPPVVQPTVAVPVEEVVERVVKVETQTAPRPEEDVPAGLSLDFEDSDDLVVEVPDVKSKKTSKKK